MLGFLVRAVIVALGLWLATAWVHGVSIDSPATLILAGILLGVVNSIVRPIAILLTLPVTIRLVSTGDQRRHGGAGRMDAAGNAHRRFRAGVLDGAAGESRQHRRILAGRSQG